MTGSSQDRGQDTGSGKENRYQHRQGLEGSLCWLGLHGRPTGREAGLGQSPLRTSGDWPRRPIRLWLPASRLGEDGGMLQDRCVVGSFEGGRGQLSPHHPSSPHGAHRQAARGLGSVRAPETLPHPRWRSARMPGLWKCLPRFQMGLPPGQPPSNSPLPSSSPVLNGILDNQSVRPSAQLGKCSSVEGDVTDGARLPPGSGEAAPPPSSPASHSSLIIMGTGVPRAEKLGQGRATWLEDGFRPFLLHGQLHRWGRIDAYQPPGGKSHLVFRRRRYGRRWDPAGNLPVQEAGPPH